MRTGPDPDDVTYACDVCGTRAPARKVRPRGDAQVQAIQPIGWFSLKGRYGQEGQSPLLRADLCSVRCAKGQIGEWAENGAGT